MVLRVRIRSGKIYRDLTSFGRMSSYVVLIGGGNKLKTVTDKEGGKEPIWEQSLTFHNNPPNVKLEVWVEHPNGDMLAGQVLLDLCNFYLRQPYRIEPKTITLVHKKQATGEIKLELDFDFDGMSAEQIKRIQKQGKKPENKPSQPVDLEIGTVVAQGKKALIKKQQAEQYQRQIKMENQRPYQKPPTAPQGYPNQNIKQPTYDYKNDPWGKPQNNNDKKFYNKPDPWTNNTNNDPWSNTNNNNTNNNGNNGWGNNNNGWDNNNGNVNIKKNDLFDFVGKMINKNDNTQKQPAKNINNDWNKPNINKNDPWSNNSDPYGNNNGWDL